MPTIYSTLQYSEQCIYRELQTKLEMQQLSCEFQGVSFDGIDKIYKAILEDHPEYFWLTGASKCTMKTRGSFSSLTFEPEFRNSALIDQVRREKSRFESKVSELIYLAKRHSYDIYEQILFLHDYIVTHTDYRGDSSNCFDAFGCLVRGEAVCSGYAAAFQVLMNRLGVECGRVRGSSASALTGEVSHVWNYIRLQDGYYFIDVTWDDPTVNAGTNRDNLTHEFFCITLNELRRTHQISYGQFVPSTTGKRYDYYRYHGLYVDEYSFEAVKPILQKQIIRGNKFSVKFGSQIQMDKAFRDLVDNQNIYSIPGIPSRLAYGTSQSELILTFFAR